MLFKTNKKVIREFSEDKKLPMKFDISMLNMCIGYVFKKSTQITRKSLMNMKRLFDIIDETVYVGNDQLNVRFEFIKNALDAMLSQGFETEQVIINYCSEHASDKKIFDDVLSNLPVYTKINYEEIKYINKAVEDRLKYYFIYNYKDMLYETVERIDSGDYRSFAEINETLANICTELITHTRRVKNIDSTNEFSLGDENFETSLIDVVTTLKNPARQIKTGIQKLNEILSPAFMSGRLYIFMGLPGGFKSGMLLKILRDTKKFNGDIQVKKPGKKPCVLLITMENDVNETVERLFNMIVSDENIRKFTPKQVIKLIKENGELTVNNNNEMDIIIRYYPNRSIDTSDIYTIIDDLADEGKEVVLFLLDYIKRIRPAEKAKDEKEELKNITNELKTLALNYDIPVVTAHQLNRSGAATVDAAMQSNKEDLARFLGRSNVGSAWEVINIEICHLTSLIAGNSLELSILN
jgi:hypothetical protein